ncbi:MAG: response regulator transcription factor [Spirochaetes bacterium]|nr:response regulator transcription factor [Spirochaetota bacterium]
MIKVIIADDHPVVRKGLKQILEESHHIVVEDEVSNGQELLEKLHTKNFDIVLLDISMPGRSGLDILKQIKYDKPNLYVLVLSMHPEEQYAIRALKAGASGYLTKESAPEELINAIIKVSRGGKYVSSSFAEKLAFSFTDDPQKPPHEKLSDREFEIMRMLASGKRVTEIAEELFLSVKTISTHRAKILKKMNFKNNAEITKYAIKNNLMIE